MVRFDFDGPEVEALDWLWWAGSGGCGVMNERWERAYGLVGSAIIYLRLALLRRSGIASKVVVSRDVVERGHAVSGWPYRSTWAWLVNSS